MTNQQPSKAMNITIWVFQVLLSLMFLFAGTMKSTQPITKLAEMMKWPGEVPDTIVRIVGVSELLAGIGLLLPSLLRIQPKLSGYAAIGLAIIQLLAIPFHLSHGEGSLIGINIFILLICIFVAWGRLSKAPIAGK